MSTADNNPVYFIEEDQKSSTPTYYRSKNQALLNKATQDNARQKRVIRLVIIAVLLVIAISCFAILRAYASTHGQLDNDTAAGPTARSLINEAAVSVVRPKVDVLEGDTLWKIANEHAPVKVNIKSYIHKIMKLNNLENAIIQEGQVLLLP